MARQIMLEQRRREQEVGPTFGVVGTAASQFSKATRKDATQGPDLANRQAGAQGPAGRARQHALHGKAGQERGAPSTQLSQPAKDVIKREKGGHRQATAGRRSPARASTDMRESRESPQLPGPPPRELRELVSPRQTTATHAANSVPTSHHSADNSASVPNSPTPDHLESLHSRSDA